MPDASPKETDALPLPQKERKESSSPWYALRTFHCREEKLEAWLKGLGLACFIPMRYAEVVPKEGGKPKRALVPAVHNLLFLQKAFPSRRLRTLMADSPVPFAVLKKADGSAPQEIPERMMAEFRAVCDPGYSGTLYIGSDEADTRPGSRVRVVRGPFTGLEGKLTRYKGRYYVVVSLATVGVLVHIPKWYCEKLPEGE